MEKIKEIYQVEKMIKRIAYLAKLKSDYGEYPDFEVYDAQIVNYIDLINEIMNWRKDSGIYQFSYHPDKDRYDLYKQAAIEILSKKQV